MVTDPIHENGKPQRTHGQRPALPWWWRQAGTRTLETDRSITVAGQCRICTGFPV